MDRVVWTDQAHGHLSDIGEYLRRAAPQYTESLLRALVGATDQLQWFPRLGRVVPGVEEYGLRELIFENYRIVYSIDDDNVSIVAVLHGATDVEDQIRKLRNEGE